MVALGESLLSVHGDHVPPNRRSNCRAARALVANPEPFAGERHHVDGANLQTTSEKVELTPYNVNMCVCVCIYLCVCVCVIDFALCLCPLDILFANVCDTCRNEKER